MKNKVYKIILALLTVVVFTGAAYAFLGGEWNLIYDKYFPCRRVIGYSLGAYDERFGITQTDFLKAIAEAEAVWEKPFTKNFFQYQESGRNTLKVNLVYDYRQAATAKINDLGVAISDTRASYDSLKAKYDSLQQKYQEDKNEYGTWVAELKEKQTAYNAKVDYWNKRGGAPKEEYQALKAEGEALQLEVTKIHKLEATINKEAEEINALVVVLNDLAKTLNINADLINTVGEKRGEEFTEGEYRQDRKGEEIDIYEFSTKAKLVRLLAHELGHALGLEHVDDPKAIMYRLNQSSNNEPTQADLDAVKEHCGIK